MWIDCYYRVLIHDSFLMNAWSYGSSSWIVVWNCMDYCPFLLLNDQTANECVNYGQLVPLKKRSWNRLDKSIHQKWRRTSINRSGGVKPIGIRNELTYLYRIGNSTLKSVTTFGKRTWLSASIFNCFIDIFFIWFRRQNFNRISEW